MTIWLNLVKTYMTVLTCAAQGGTLEGNDLVSAGAHSDSGKMKMQIGWE